MKTEYIAIAIMLIVAGILLYYGFISFIKNKSLDHDRTTSTINIQSLVQALGGLDNIQEITHTASKVSVKLQSQDSIDVKTIQSLGASGIVEGKETLSMIFGKQSPLIAEDLENLK